MRPAPARATSSVGARLAIAAWVVIASLVALAVPAAAQTVVIPDPIAVEDDSDLAAAVALLVRSSVAGGQRTIAPRRQLALAIEAATGHPPEKNLNVAASQASKVLEQLGAESLVLWELSVGPKGTQVGGTLLGPGGKRLLRIAASAATGDVTELARQLARRIAPALSSSAAVIPDVGLADLRPVVQAERALIVHDGVALTRSLELVLPKVAAENASARQVLRDVATDPALSALPRAQALLLVGDWDAALARADAGLSSDGKNILLRAAKVRALAARKQFAEAEREIASLRATHNPSVLALAQVALAVARGDGPDKLAEALSPLFGRPAVEWRPVLPFIAASAPGSFGERGEAAALLAAQKLAQYEPGLASTLATRALVGGAKVQDTAAMIKVEDLSTEQVKSVAGRLGGEGGAAAGLGQQIKAREEEANLIAAAAGRERPSGPPSALASNLRTILQDFAALYDPKVTAIAIAPLPGSGQPFYWPFLIRKQRLAEGLIEALMRSPWELDAEVAKLSTETMPADRFSDEGMTTIAHELGATAVLFYRISPSGLAPWARLELYLFDPAHQHIERIEASMIGRPTGLMVLSPLWIAVFALICLAVVVWGVMVSLRGTIIVRVQWDSDAKDEMFSVLISRRPQTPTIENVAAYRKKMEWIGKRKRRFEAWNVEQNTTFRGIPRGKWHVHLYGIYTRGRQTLVLKEPPQVVEVPARKTVFVAHVLEAAEAEFKLLVVDDHGPVEGARVWLDDQRAKAVASTKGGAATIKVPKGYHVIHVSARGMDVERPYHVVKAKVHEMTINLVWEKRQEYVSRALERQVDDAAPYLTQPGQKQASSKSIPIATSAVDPQPSPPPSRAKSATATVQPAEGLEIRLTDTPVAVSQPKPAAVPARGASPPRIVVPPAGVSPQPPAGRPAVGQPTVTLRPLAPETSPKAPADPKATVDLNMVPDVPPARPPRRR